MNGKDTTLILGASSNLDRYSYLAAERLWSAGREFVMVGNREGELFGIPILTEWPNVEIHTITLYVGPRNQVVWYDKILNSRAQRVIFNPGTENSELEKMLLERNIKPIQACTLVMLATGQY